MSTRCYELHTRGRRSSVALERVKNTKLSAAHAATRAYVADARLRL